jgi:hypothetical protein
LQFPLAIGDELFHPRRGGRGPLLVRRQRLLARTEVLFRTVSGGETIGEGAGLIREALLQADDFLTPVARLAFRLGRKLVRFFASLERRLLSQRFRVALGLFQRSIRFVSGASDCIVSRPALRGSAPEECAARDQTYEQRGDSS